MQETDRSKNMADENKAEKTFPEKPEKTEIKGQISNIGSNPPTINRENPLGTAELDWLETLCKPDVTEEELRTLLGRKMSPSEKRVMDERAVDKDKRLEWERMTPEQRAQREKEERKRVEAEAELQAEKEQRAQREDVNAQSKEFLKGQFVKDALKDVSIGRQYRQQASKETTEKLNPLTKAEEAEKAWEEKKARQRQAEEAAKKPAAAAETTPTTPAEPAKGKSAAPPEIQSTTPAPVPVIREAEPAVSPQEEIPVPPAEKREKSLEEMNPQELKVHEDEILKTIPEGRRGSLHLQAIEMTKNQIDKMSPEERARLEGTTLQFQMEIANLKRILEDEVDKGPSQIKPVAPASATTPEQPATISGTTPVETEPAARKAGIEITVIGEPETSDERNVRLTIDGEESGITWRQAVPKDGNPQKGAFSIADIGSEEGELKIPNGIRIQVSCLTRDGNLNVNITGGKNTRIKLEDLRALPKDARVLLLTKDLEEWGRPKGLRGLIFDFVSSEFERKPGKARIFYGGRGLQKNNRNLSVEEAIARFRQATQ